MEFLPAIIAAGASFVGAWMAAHLALRRFYQERVWERKTVAYTAIFGALHDMRLWFDEHMRAHERGHELPGAEKNRLSAEYQKAKANLRRRLDTEGWLLPLEYRDRLDKLTYDLEMEHVHNWFELLDNGQFLISTAIDQFRSDVRQDLQLERKSWRSVLRARLAAMKIFGAHR